ncbi:MAG: hypothetical protein J07HX5_01711 [halophilic archaeon J07HX5]|nr:MAG: hypothetical protein J07HX5_01711 [halophilic archaeon J07HX5]
MTMPSTPTQSTPPVDYSFASLALFAVLPIATIAALSAPKITLAFALGAVSAAALKRFRR